MRHDSRFLRFGLVNFFVMFSGLLVYWVLWGWMVANIDLTWLQNAMAYWVYVLQAPMGIDVVAVGNTLQYSSPAFGVELITLCLGIGEMMFFAFIVMLFRGVRLGTKLRGLALFLPMIFVVNIARLLILYPMATIMGTDAMWDVHWHIWKWGMFVVLILFFLMWYALMARKDIERGFSFLGMRR
ncbi:MAG: hypothetical protein DRO99_04120 [Candidatus Aenigmatarchaeota archaeon]|nr:MAG: hypothetical protein DRO99_04120 [Candidatus Aenigmarchaeota archaeon]